MNVNIKKVTPNKWPKFWVEGVFVLEVLGGSFQVKENFKAEVGSSLFGEGYTISSLETKGKNSCVLQQLLEEAMENLPRPEFLDLE